MDFQLHFSLTESHPSVIIATRPCPVLEPGLYHPVSEAGLSKTPAKNCRLVFYRVLRKDVFPGYSDRLFFDGSFSADQQEAVINKFYLE
jgi:hypothetical protein